LRRRQDLWQSARERHADYYAGFVASQFSRMQGAEQMAAAQDLSDEFNTNVKAAWDWLVENARWALIREKMLPGLFQFGLMRWRSDELITWMQNARSRIQPGLGPEEKLTFAILGTTEVNFEEIWGFKENRPEDRMESLWSLAVTEGLADEMGVWFILLGKLYTYRKIAPEAEALLDNAIDRLRTVGDPWQLGSALLLRSSLWGQFPTEAADRNLSEALKIFKNLGTIHEQAIILENMAANASVRKLPLDEVIDLYQQAQGYYLKLNDPFGVGETYKNLGDLYFSQGQREKGFEAYHEMRRAFERLGDLRLVSESLSWESLWATRYSTFQHALETRQRCLGLSRKYGSQTIYFWNVFELGEVYRIFGDCQKAREFFNEAGEYFEGIHFTLGKGYIQRAFGDIAMGEGRYAEACRHYQAFQNLVEQDNHMWSMAQACVKMAWVEAHLGNVPGSRSSIYRCLKSLLDTNEVNLILEALLCEARCLAEEGKTGPSADLAAIVRDHPVTWNETRSLARSLVEALSENRTLDFLQGPGSIPQANDVRGLASNWIANYEAGLFSS
jgi:tetratricopeptide (TPR) repeat protein